MRIQTGRRVEEGWRVYKFANDTITLRKGDVFRTFERALPRYEVPCSNNPLTAYLNPVKGERARLL